MKMRPGNDPKRRIMQPGMLAFEQNNKLTGYVRYVGSGHHKRNPADYGLTRTSLRPTQSLCDLRMKWGLTPFPPLPHCFIDRSSLEWQAVFIITNNIQFVNM